MASLTSRKQLPNDRAARTVPVRRARSLAPLVSVLTLIALLVIVTGPSLSSAFVESSPYHSHIYLAGGESLQGRPETTQSHGHGMGEQEVVSVFDHSGGSSFSSFHIFAAPDRFEPARLAARIQMQLPETPRADAPSQLPERPPRRA